MTIKCSCGFITTFEMDCLPKRHKCYSCKAIMQVKDREEKPAVLKVKRK